LPMDGDRADRLVVSQHGYDDDRPRPPSSTSSVAL
jgi:hypothetical protein